MRVLEKDHYYAFCRMYSVVLKLSFSWKTRNFIHIVSI